jgi:hypothetical protein
MKTSGPTIRGPIETISTVGASIIRKGNPALLSALLGKPALSRFSVLGILMSAT